MYVFLFINIIVMYDWMKIKIYQISGFSLYYSYILDGFLLGINLTYIPTIRFLIGGVNNM